MMELTSRLKKKPASRTARAPIPPLPTWATALVGQSAPTHKNDDLHLTLRHGDGVALISVRVPNADALAAKPFEQKAIDVYRAIREAVGPLHPVRFWNYLPRIHQAMDGRRDRYVV